MSERAGELIETRYNSESKILTRSISSDSNNEYIRKLHGQYEDDLDELMKTTSSEKNVFLETATCSQQTLKTIIYGQHSRAIEKRNKDQERYLQQKIDVTSTVRCTEYFY